MNKRRLTRVIAVTVPFLIGAMAYAQAPTDPQIVGIVQTANRY